MKHLSDEQLADAAGDAPGPAEAAHLSSCVPCATKVREARSALLEVTAVEVPEPSPFFWPHLLRRVNESIDAAQADRGAWPLRWVAAWAAAAICLITVVGIWVLRPAEAPTQIADVKPPVEQASPAASATAVEPPDIDEDEAWAIVRTLAAELHYDDAREAGVVPRPGAVEHAATELSEVERAQLIRLIEEDLEHKGDTDGETR